MTNRGIGTHQIRLSPAEVRARVDAALAEVGYIGEVRPPGPTSPKGTRFCITAGAVPLHITWKALALIAITEHGPDLQVKCPVHTRNVPEDNDCPLYPVGALLAGVISGCEPEGRSR